jgi:hypothetical protein
MGFGLVCLKMAFWRIIFCPIFGPHIMARKPFITCILLSFAGSKNWTKKICRFRRPTLKNKSSVVETTSDNAFVFRNNEITAVSYRGIPPATKRIGHTSLLTPSESKILDRLENKRIRIEEGEDFETETHEDDSKVLYL